MSWALGAFAEGPMCAHVYMDMTKSDLVIHLLQQQEDRAMPHLDVKTVKAVFDPHLPVFQDRLIQVLSAKNQSFEESLKDLYGSLYFPEDLIKARLEMSKHLTPENILSVLGDLSLPETLRLFVGRDPAHIAADSLLGRYLEETGLKAQTHRFKEQDAQKDGTFKESPDRLEVLVDAKTFPIFMKYFSNQQSYSAQGHGNMLFGGKLYMFGVPVNVVEPRPMSAGTPLPMVLLKTTEGARMGRYMQAMATAYPGLTDGWQTPARSPWSQIPGKDGKLYLSVNGHFNCCTHWHGNIPLGDNLVNDIVLPGDADQPLIAHVNEPDYSNPVLAPVKDVWTAPLHEPISAVLGLADANGPGEFSSPGWVIQSLLVSAPIERVPFVLIFANDAQVPLPENFFPRFERPW